MNTLEMLMSRYNKSLLTTKEVIQELGVNKDTLKKLRDTGEIKFKKIGADVKFKLTDIADFIDR